MSEFSTEQDMTSTAAVNILNILFILHFPNIIIDAVLHQNVAWLGRRMFSDFFTRPVGGEAAGGSLRSSRQVAA